MVPSGANKNHTPSIISANLRIAGNLVTDGVIQLDGIVDGDVNCDDLTLGESAVINGSIEGNRVRVSGTVNGENGDRYSRNVNDQRRRRQTLHLVEIELNKPGNNSGHHQTDSEIGLSLERMNAIEEIDTDNRTMTVQATR